MGQRKRYSRQFKLDALELVRTSGKTQTEIERDLGLYGGQLSDWKKQLAQDGDSAFPGSGNVKESDAEMRRLRRENELLRRERDILKKAIAIFSHPKG